MFKKMQMTCSLIMKANTFTIIKKKKKKHLCHTMFAFCKKAFKLYIYAKRKRYFQSINSVFI